MTRVRGRVAMPNEGTVSSRTVVLIGLGWLVIATGVGAVGIVSTLRPPALPLVLFGLTAVVLGAGWFSTGFRAWLLAIDVRWLVGLHLTRFVGAYHERATKAGVPYTNVDTQAALSYAAWQLLEAAVTATKSLDDKAMAQWLRKSQVPTIVGRLRFDGPNNYGDDLSKVKQAQGGKWVVVWPKEFAAPGARLLPQ